MLDPSSEQLGGMEEGVGFGERTHLYACGSTGVGVPSKASILRESHSGLSSPVASTDLC